MLWRVAGDKDLGGSSIQDLAISSSCVLKKGSRLRNTKPESEMSQQQFASNLSVVVITQGQMDLKTVRGRYWGDTGLDNSCNCTIEERSSPSLVRSQSMEIKHPLRGAPAGKVGATGFACMKRRFAGVAEPSGMVDAAGFVVLAKDQWGGREPDI